MTKTQVACLPFGLTSFWLGKSNQIAGIDGIVFFLLLSLLISINLIREYHSQ